MQNVVHRPYLYEGSCWLSKLYQSERIKWKQNNRDHRPTPRNAPMKFHQNRSTLRPVIMQNLESLPLWPPGRTLGEGDQKYMKCRILSIQHTYMKAHMDWPNCVQDKGGQTCEHHPPARPPAGHSDNIIPRHMKWWGTKTRHTCTCTFILQIHVPIRCTNIRCRINLRYI